MHVTPLTAAPVADLDAALAAFPDREVTLEGVPEGAYRQAFRDGETVTVWDADGADVTASQGPWVEALKAFDCESALVEGVDAAAGPFVTDLLSIDGADLAQRPLRDRLARLAEIAPAKYMPERVTTDLAAWASAFVSHIQTRGYVGLLVRDPDTPRSPGLLVTWAGADAEAAEVAPYDGMCATDACETPGN